MMMMIIIINVNGVMLEVMRWIHLYQDYGPVYGCCEDGNELMGFIKLE